MRPPNPARQHEPTPNPQTASPTPSKDPKRDQTVITRTSIRGTFAPAQLKDVVYLIKSLCPEVGSQGEFRDWDRVYNPPPDARAPKNSVRLRQHLVVRNVATSVPNFGTFSLMFYGLPDRRVQQPCEKRPITSAAVGKEAEVLLEAMGCTFSYEYVRKGMRCQFRDGYTVDVYVVEKLKEKHDIKTCEPLVGDDHHGIVEISSEDGATPEQLSASMQFLQPLVVLRSPQKRN